MHGSNDIGLMSIHAPKAAGTALRSILQRHFGEAYMDDYADDPANPLSQRNLDPARYFARKEPYPPGISCIHGHMHAGKYAEGDHLLVTFLRHPVDNLISIYYFWNNLKPGQHGALFAYFHENNLSLLDMARLPLLRHLFTRTYFGGLDMSRFAVIASHEEREAGLRRIGRLLGIESLPDWRENHTPLSEARANAESDPALRRELEDILIEDVRFYERWAR